MSEENIQTMEKVVKACFFSFTKILLYIEKYYVALTYSKFLCLIINICIHL